MMLLHHILRLRLVSKENLNSDMDCHSDNNSNSVAILFCSYLPNGNQEEGREEEGKTRQREEAKHNIWKISFYLSNLSQNRLTFIQCF